MKLRLIYCFLLMLVFQNGFAADVPTNVTLTATETTVTVDWTGDSDADNYFVYWGTSSNNLDRRVTVDDSVTEYTITGLETGTTYHVAVSSNDNSVESDRSDVESITTLEDTGIPSTPTGLFITGRNAIGQNSVTLKWDENTESDLDHYNISYDIVSGSYANVLEADSADAESLAISGLTSSARYYFTISAVDTSGNESEKADELIADTLPDSRPPNKPAGISGVLSDAHSITVTISDSNSQMADFSGNILFYGESADSLDNRIDLDTSFSYVLNNLPMGSTWYFSAVSYDFAGNESAATDVISVDVEETTRFLNQPDDFDGGCFITASGRFSSIPVYNLFFMMAGIFLMVNRRKILKFGYVILTVAVMSLSFSSVADATEGPEMPGNNIVGIAAGYFVPSESDFEDYYGEDLFPVYGFYERFFSQHFSIDVESGFMKEKGYLLTGTGESTRIKSKITLVPVSASLKFSMKLLPYVVGYVGLGPDYWYCQEETDDKTEHPEIEEWVGGYHGKIGVRLYNTDDNYRGSGALVESSYSRIDRFGDNNTDIGGWTFKFGVFYHF